MGTDETAPKYDANIVLGDFKLRQGKEDRIIDVAGKHTLYGSKSENRYRVVSFTQIYPLIIVNTKFQH
jgi:hypothetical protein